MREKSSRTCIPAWSGKDYSDESIKFFLSVLEKWLTRHIIGHDREIVQKALSDAAGEDGAQPEMKTAAGNLPGASRPTRAELSSAEGRGGTGYRRGVFLLAMTLVIFGAAYAAGGLLVKSRVDRLDELKASTRSEENSLARLKAATQAEATSLAGLKAAVRAEEAALAELKSKTWGLRLTTFPDGTGQLSCRKA